MSALRTELLVGARRSLTGGAFAVLLLAAALTPLGSTMVATALPSIGLELGREAAGLTAWLALSYLVVSIALQGPGGRLGDALGHERVLLVGSSLFGLGAILGALGPAALPSLVAARALMAAGGAISIPAVMALVRNGTAEERRARRFGLFGAAMGLAATVGPWLGGVLSAHLGWRAVFAANLPVLAAAVPLVRARARASRGLRIATSIATVGPPARIGSVDLAGPLLLTAGALLLALVGRGGAHRGELLAGAAALLLAFAARELRAPAPAFDLRLFRRSALGAASLASGFGNAVQYALLFALPIELTRAGEDGTAAGKALLALLAGNLIAAPLGGRIGERIGARAAACVGSLTALLGFAMLPAPAELGAGAALALAPGLLAIGLGLGLGQAPAQAAGMSAAGADEAGRAAAVLSTTRYLGGLFGVALLTGAVTGGATWSRGYVAAIVAQALVALALPGRVGSGATAVRERATRAAA